MIVVDTSDFVLNAPDLGAWEEAVEIESNGDEANATPLRSGDSRDESLRGTGGSVRLGRTAAKQATTSIGRAAGQRMDVSVDVQPEYGPAFNLVKTRLNGHPLQIPNFQPPAGTDSVRLVAPYDWTKNDQIGLEKKQAHDWDIEPDNTEQLYKTIQIGKVMRGSFHWRSDIDYYLMEVAKNNDRTYDLQLCYQGDRAKRSSGLRVVLHSMV